MRVRRAVTIGIALVEGVRSIFGFSTALAREPPTEPPAGVKKHEGEKKNEGVNLSPPPVQKEEPLQKEPVPVDRDYEKKMTGQMYDAVDLALKGSTTVERTGDIFGGPDSYIPLTKGQDNRG